jgi:Zn-dependent peptidase ImmA (M78 family)/transcriptional regulator with XRE-family HTH domain
MLEQVIGMAQPRMLVLARESRAMTQGQLAKAMQALEGSDGKVSQGYVSRAEAGRLTVNGERLGLYARALHYPAQLLCLTEHEVGAGPGLVHHRKKQATSTADLRRIHALLNLTRIQLRALLSGVVARPAGIGIPHIPVDAYNTPEEAARRVRAQWGIPKGPIDSVVSVVEDAGALVACRDLVPPVPLDSGGASVPLDAVSGCPPGEDPVVLLNAGTPGDRQRFTLAHELGHMVMHPVPHPEQEKQANRFAAELLMPAQQIWDQLHGQIDVQLLLELKGEWKVSMWALLRRANTLGITSDWQYRSLAVEMSSLGYRTTEPGELEPEMPTAVTSLVNQLLQQGHNVDELASATYLHTDEFSRLYLSRPINPGVGLPSRSVAPTNREAAT